MRGQGFAYLLALMVAGCAGHGMHSLSDPASVAAQELPQKRLATKPWLDMPDSASGHLPALLSQTGAFTSLAKLGPAKALLPYDLVVPFWSDGAVKTRFVAIPEAKVTFSATGDWKFPPGTVFVKTFELPTDATQANQRRRLETRLL